MQTPEQIREQYEVETELADRLRNAPRAERAKLYGHVYDELFQRVPHHPQLTRKQDESARAAAVAERFALVSNFLGHDVVFLEVGAGDCSLSRQVAGHVRKAYALDVSREILDGRGGGNLETVLSDGCSIPLPPGSVTLAYSYQVMEHIHPDDAMEQLRNIYTVLAPGGKYLCVTPSRLNGPHDVSQFFDARARGFHLREYTVGELSRIFRNAGFRRVEPYVGFRHRYFRVPLIAMKVFEAVFGLIPWRLRRRIGNLRGIQNLLFISLLAVK